MTYHHGVKVVEVNAGTRSLQTISTAVIGLVATADDADAAFFPLNQPVLITNIETAIGKAGITGSLIAALLAISDHARSFVIVVRVAHSNVANTLTANVIGTVTAGGDRTGMQALLGAQSMLGVKPRILGAPGLDNQAVTTAMAVIAAKLGGMVYASCGGAGTNADALAYRANFAARELMLITPDVKTVDAAGVTVATSAIGRALGLRAKIDQEIGWHKTLSNVALSGVLGITRAVEFDLQSADNDAGLLNAAQITTIVRRDGYRFWGSRTCSDEPLFAFESAVRTAQVLRDTIAEGIFWAIDKPLTPGLVKDILSTINHKFSQLRLGGYIIGGEASFDPAKNDKAQLSAGMLDIDYDYTPVAPLEALGLTQRITDRFYADFNTGLAAA